MDAFDIDQTKCCYVDAIVLKVFEIKRLDVLLMDDKSLFESWNT